MGRRIIDVADISAETPLYKQVERWLADNGIDPREVPMDSEMVITDDAITFQRYPRDENGAYRIDKGRDALIREAATVPKKSAPESFGL